MSVFPICQGHYEDEDISGLQKLGWWQSFKNHMYERESSAEEKLYGYLRQGDIFKCFECWLRICKKRSKQTFILKVLPENTPGLIFMFLNNDSSKSPLYNHKKIKTLQGMILAV